MSKHNKTPQKHATKAQLDQLVQNKKEIARKRKIVVEKFYPALMEATTSVDEAKALLHAMSAFIMESVMHTMKEKKLVEILDKVITGLSPGGERAQEVGALLGTIQEENLFVAREIIEGMSRAVDAMVTEELRGRKLDTLKTNWEGYLN